MATKKEEVKFEDNLAELENIVRKLESGDVALEDAIAEFQKGMKISETLKKTLNEAEETLVKIVGKELLAQALAHEIDHLDGILFVDNMLPGTLQFVEPEENEE